MRFDFDKTGRVLNRKPKEVLKQKIKYKKEQLKNFVNKLNFKELFNESKSFKTFYKVLV